VHLLVKNWISTILMFTWREWGKPQKMWVSIFNILVEIWTRNLPNTIRKCNHFRWLALLLYIPKNRVCSLLNFLNGLPQLAVLTFPVRAAKNSTHYDTERRVLVCCSISLHHAHMMSMFCDMETFKIHHCTPHWLTKILFFHTSSFKQK
jgi:hypothetical protein